MGYQINKGVGAPLDFFGLKSQYIAFYLVGLLLAFILFFVFQLESKVLGFVVGASVAVVTYIVCHWANRKYGVTGVTVAMAHRLLPNRVPSRRIMDIVRITKR